MLISIKRRLGVAIATIGLVACGGSDAAAPDGSPAAPPDSHTTPPAAPSLVLSTDSVVATLTAGADRVTQDIDITAGTSAAISGLSVAEPTVGSGLPTGWITATVSTQTAPAKLSVSIDPRQLSAGTYSAQIKISATNAEAKTLRVSLVVRPRPRLVIDRTTLSLGVDFEQALPTQTINVSSVDGAVGGLSLGAVTCDKTPASWLSVSLSAAVTPAIVTLSAATNNLAIGSYSCSVNLSTPQTLVDSATQTIRVSLAVRGVPKMAFSVESVRLQAIRQSDASTGKLVITNAGSGTLGGLTVGAVTYSEGATDWLMTAFDSTTAPATLTFSARTMQAAGIYTATVPIASIVGGTPGPSKVLTVTYQVDPRPSALSVSPNSFSFTISKSSDPGAFVLMGVAALTATGDTQLGHIAFGPAFSVVPSLGWAVGCVGQEFVTPCTVHVTYQGPASALTVGSYSGFFQLKSFIGGQTATVSLQLRVVP